MQVQGSNPTAARYSNHEPDRRLRNAGQTFEGMLLADVFSKLQESFASSGEDSSDPGHESLTGMACEALGSGLAARGGIGLGKMMIHAINRSSSNAELPIAQLDTSSAIIRKL